MVQQAINQRRRHDLVTEDGPHSSKPLLEVSTVEGCS